MKRGRQSPTWRVYDPEGGIFISKTRLRISESVKISPDPSLADTSHRLPGRASGKPGRLSIKRRNPIQIWIFLVKR
jgi:hypothetical protein